MKTQNSRKTMKKFKPTPCFKCGKPLVPNKKAKVFGTMKWDKHTFRYSCKCLGNKNFRIEIG